MIVSTSPLLSGGHFADAAEAAARDLTRLETVLLAHALIRHGAGLREIVRGRVKRATGPGVEHAYAYLCGSENERVLEAVCCGATLLYVVISEWAVAGDGERLTYHFKGAFDPDFRPAEHEALVTPDTARILDPEIACRYDGVRGRLVSITPHEAEVEWRDAPDLTRRWDPANLLLVVDPL